MQTEKFGAEVAIARGAVGLDCATRPYQVRLATGEVVRTRTVVIASGARYRKPLLTLGPDAERTLAAHAWPGNVRELRNAIEQAVLIAEAPTVRATDLRLGSGALGDAGGESDLNLERAERRLIAEAMARSQDNVTAAARLLGISRDTLRYRLERLALRDGTADAG